MQPTSRLRTVCDANGFIDVALKGELKRAQAIVGRFHERHEQRESSAALGPNMRLL